MIVNFGLMLDRFSLGWLFVLTVIIVLISIAAGFRLARYIRRHSERVQDAPIVSIVGAMLGLLAFTMAFTFGMTASRFETRRQLVLDESNAIGTAFLRAGLLPEPLRSEVRKLFREYAGIRVEAFQSRINSRSYRNVRRHCSTGSGSTRLLPRKRTPGPFLPGSLSSQ